MKKEKEKFESILYAISLLLMDAKSMLRDGLTIQAYEKLQTVHTYTEKMRAEYKE